MTIRRARVGLALLLLSACSSDDSGGDEQMPTDGGLADATVDAAALADAASQDAQADASGCTGGQVSCDGTCIDPIAATGSAVIERIFAKSCGFASSCHGGTSPKEGLALDTVDRMFSTAVDKSSKQKTGAKLITPGDADASYLLHKLQGEQLAEESSAGEPSTIMPQPPSDPLCPVKIEAVRAWIEAGAAR